MFRARPQTRPVPGLHPSTRRRSMMIDSAGDPPANTPTQRQALAIGRQSQVRHALRIVRDVFTQQIFAPQNLIVRLDLHPVVKSFRPIARQVGATRSAFLAIKHAAWYAVQARKATPECAARSNLPSHSMHVYADCRITAAAASAEMFGFRSV